VSCLEKLKIFNLFFSFILDIIFLSFCIKNGFPYLVFSCSPFRFFLALIYSFNIWFHFYWWWIKYFQKKQISSWMCRYKITQWQQINILTGERKDVDKICWTFLKYFPLIWLDVLTDRLTWTFSLSASSLVLNFSSTASSSLFHSNLWTHHFLLCFLVTNRPAAFQQLNCSKTFWQHLFKLQQLFQLSLFHMLQFTLYVL